MLIPLVSPALLLGVASELEVSAILTTEVSLHARSAVREADLARRIMHAAKEESRLPQGYHKGLMAHRDRKPFPHSPAEIAETARGVKDPSFRVQVSDEGVHVYNRDGMHVALDPYALFPKLGLADDAPHAFYMGVELARAEIALQLGKRYVQDERLAWGCLVSEEQTSDLYKSAGSTLEARTRGKKT